MTNRTSITIADGRDVVLHGWKDALQDFSSIHIASNHEIFSKKTCFDAVVLPVAWAHERLGGKPIFERAQVLATQGQSHDFVGNPTFVVTTVPFPGKLHVASDAEGKRTFKIVPRLEMSSRDKSYTLFKGVLRAVDEFNLLHPDSIRTILFDLEIIGFSPDAIAEEADGARTAITDCGLLSMASPSDAPASSKLDSSIARRENINRLSETIEAENFRTGDLFDRTQVKNIIEDPVKVREFYVSYNLQSQLKELKVSVGLLIDAITDEISRIKRYKFNDRIPSKWPIALDFEHDKSFYRIFAVLNVNRGHLSVNKMEKYNSFYKN